MYLIYLLNQDIPNVNTVGRNFKLEARWSIYQANKTDYRSSSLVVLERLLRGSSLDFTSL